MADPHAAPAAAEPSSVQSPLLAGAQNDHDHQQQQQGRDLSLDVGDTELDQTLQKLETFLSFLGFKQSTVLSVVLSWTAFVLVGVVLPAIVLELSDCSGCEKYQMKNFELDILASQASLAAVSLFCLSHNLRKYGIRKFLFVDRHNGQMSRYRDEYIKQIKVRIFFPLPIKMKDLISGHFTCGASYSKGEILDPFSVSI